MNEPWSTFWRLCPPHLYVVIWMFVAANIYFTSLSARPLWTDEVIMLITVEMPLYDSLVQQQDYAAPLYQLLLRPLVSVAGNSEWVLRFPAALFAVLCMPTAWWLTSMLFSRNVAGMALPLMVLNPLLLQYAREARPYSLFVLLSLLSMGAFFRWLRDRRQRDMFLWIVSSVFLVNTHYYGFLYVIVQMVCAAVAVHKRRHFELHLRRRFVGVLTLIALLMLPATWRFSTIVFNGAPATLGGWLHTPTIDDVISWRYFGELFGLPNWGLLFATGIIGSLGCAILTRSHLDESPAETLMNRLPENDSTSNKAAHYRLGIALCVAWIFIGVVVPAFIIPFLWRPVYITRYGLPVIIPILLLVLVANELLFQKKLRIATPVVLVMLMLPQTMKTATNRRGFPDVVEWIQNNTDEDLPVYVADWSYVDGFINPEIVGMQYYGLDDREFRLLKLNHPYGSGFASPELIPLQERFVLVTFLNIDGIGEHFQNTTRNYQLTWLDTMAIFDVRP